MGQAIRKLFDSFFSTREMRVVMLGLDAAGKTTILYRLHMGEVLSTVPTVGFNVEKVQYKNVVFTVWDVGGQEKLRSLWKMYLSNSDALIYVVDSLDRERIGDARQEFQTIIKDPLMANSIILVFANKQDLVLCDILSTGGLPGSGKGDQPPLYFAADDLEYQAAFPSERLGMGAFRIALESIFNQINDHPLKYTSYGKPNPFVFKNAASILEKLLMSMYPNSQSSKEVKDCLFSTIYMVGDNPKVDINGALKAGHPWSSVLTRTGVFRGKDNDPQFPADAVVDTVEDAINYILEKECIR